MFSTIVFICLACLWILLTLGLWVFALRIGLRWAGVENLTTQRLVLAMVIVVAMSVAVKVLFVISITSTPKILLDALIVLLGAAFHAIAIMTVFRASFLRSLQSWLPTFVTSVAMLLLTFFVVRSLGFEAFAIRTNAMAPTLLGKHWKDTCPKCGESAYCSPSIGNYSDPDSLLICEKFHAIPSRNVDPKVHFADRIMVAKFLRPERWDLIVFRFPEDPNTVYVKRLVGMPGEVITITKGGVWADGKRLTPPEALRGIEYTTEFPYEPALVWGDVNNPAALGDDEYFVLGDFSQRSKDSRLWQTGAPGHAPFAVPASHIKGIVTHIYWPPERSKILR